MGELGPHDSASSNVDNAATLEGKLLLVVEPRAQGLAFDEGHHAVAVRERGGESIGGRVQRPDPKRGLGTLRRLSILGPPSGCCILWLGFDELVERFNQVEAQYRSDLRELNELNFARFDAKVEQLALIAGLYLR